MPLSRFPFLLACLVLVLSATARAQHGHPASPLATLPSLPAIPGAVPINAPTPAAGPDTIRLTPFVNAPIGDVLKYYETLSGKHVIYDNAVQGSITLDIATPVTRAEALHLIEAQLNLDGYALIPAEGDLTKVISIGKNPRQFGVPIFYDLADVPDTDQIVSFLVHLHYLEPQETAGILTQYIQPNTNIAFTPLVKAGAILITDTGRSVRRLVTLINQIDLPASPVTERFFNLQRADATKAVEFLNSVFETKTSGTTTASNPTTAAIPGVPGPRRPIRRVGDDGVPVEGGAAAIVGPNGALSLNGDSLIYGRISLTADVRTNRVYVVTSPVNMPVVESVLREYDADTPFATPVRRALQFVSAKDVLPILVQALTEPGTDANGNGSTPGATNPSRNGVNSNNANNSNGNSLNSSNGGSFGGSGSGSGSSNVGQSELDTPPVDTFPIEATVGNTKLIGDQRNNAIIILGGTEARDKVFEVLNQLDVRTPQVYIRTVIGELSITDDHEFGLNYLLRSNRGSILSQSNSAQLVTSNSTTGTATGTTTGGTTGTTGTAAAASSGASTLNTFTTLATGLASNFSGVGGIIAIGKSFDIILSALESTSRFKTISNPSIFTQNNKKALIASGQEIAVPTQSLSSSTGSTLGTAGISTNVDYKDVTLQLEVVPFINSKNEVTLDIYQQVDSLVTGSSTVVAGNPIPTIATRKLRNTVSAPNNSTIVLGGLITEDENKSNNDIPYLNKIPILGKLLFSTRTRDKDRSELIILMHPEVVSTNPEQLRLREKEEDKTYLGRGLEQQLDPIEVRRALPVKGSKIARAKPTPTPFYVNPTGK